MKVKQLRPGWYEVLLKQENMGPCVWQFAADSLEHAKEKLKEHERLRGKEKRKFQRYAGKDARENQEA